MVATAFISMWISNTATAAMMYPIVLAITPLFGGAPMVALLPPLCWALLVFVIFPSRATLDASASAVLRDRRAALGPLRGGELATLCVFTATAGAWLARGRQGVGSG